MKLFSGDLDLQVYYKHAEQVEDHIQRLKQLIKDDPKKTKDKIEFELSDGTVIHMNIGKVLINLIIGKSLISMGLLTEETLAIKTGEIFGPHIVSNAINFYIIPLFEGFDNGIEIINNITYDIINELMELTNENKIINSISLKSFLDIADNDRIREILTSPIDTDLFNTTLSIEQRIKELSSEMFELLQQTKGDLQPYIENGLGLKQFAQLMVKVGLKPDIMGNIYPELINSNFLTGLRNEDEYFANAKGSMVALVNNKSQVPMSGYLTRKLLLLMMNMDVAQGTICGTREDNLTERTLTKDLLVRHNRRHYVQDGVTKTIDSHDESLIGQTVKIYSPITCSLVEVDGKKHICERCYSKSIAKKNTGKSVGLIAALRLTEILTQMLLSTKHLLITDSSDADYDWAKLEKYFGLLLNSFVSLSTDKLVVDLDEFRENSIRSLTMVKDGQDIEDGDVIDIEVIGLQIENDVEFVIDEAENVAIISPNEGQGVFTFAIKNKGLSNGLQKLLQLLTKGFVFDDDVDRDELSTKELIEYIYNEYTNILISNNIFVTSLDIELILRGLIDVTSNFDADNPTVEIMKLDQKLLKKSPLAISLAFEKLSQILNVDIFNRVEPSYLDRLFI